MYACTTVYVLRSIDVLESKKGIRSNISDREIPKIQNYSVSHTVKSHQRIYVRKLFYSIEIYLSYNIVYNILI